MRLAKVWCTTSLAEADILCVHLRHFDIESQVQNVTAFWTIGLPCSAIPFVLVVAAYDEDQARELLLGAWAAWTARAGPPPAAGDPEKLSCSDLFDITPDEDQRLSRLVSRERRRTLILWWLVIVFGYNEALIFWIVLQLSFALARRFRRAKAPGRSVE